MRDRLIDETTKVAQRRGGRAVSVDLTGARVFITGGSRGIAAAMVRAFAASGAKVAFSYAPEADRAIGQPDITATVLDELGREGREVHAIATDLTVPGEAAISAAAASKLLGGIDILVLSASIQVHRTFLNQTASDVARQLQINLIANIETMQHVIPGMRARGWGRIITIGSVQETAPSAEMPIYAMCKAALENLVRNLAVENARHGVTVNNIAPGLVQTDRNAFRRQDPGQWANLAERANPMRRAGQPADIVGAALYLASDSASFVTGATIQITGGAHIARGAIDQSTAGPAPPVSSS